MGKSTYKPKLLGKSSETVPKLRYSFFINDGIITQKLFDNPKMKVLILLSVLAMHETQKKLFHLFYT